MKQITGQIKEFKTLLAALADRAVPIQIAGVSEIHKAQIIATVQTETRRPIVIVCADSGEIANLRRDVELLTGAATQILPERSFIFYQADSVSHQIEQTRLAALYALAAGQVPILFTTAEALMQRTIPKTVLLDAALPLAVGDTHNLGELTKRFVRAGFSRSEQVEGVGQFALRGGILDFYSPAHDFPVRCEFFGDEIDTMHQFDPATQRRGIAITESIILPCAESLPTLHPKGTAGLTVDLESLLNRAKRRKNPPEQLLSQLEADLARLKNDLALAAADKYMACIYPEFATPLDYLPPDAVVLLSEPKRLMERGRGHMTQHRDDMQTLLEAQVLEGSLAVFIRSWAEICADLASNYTVVLLETFNSGAGDGEGVLHPRTLIQVFAKQLPSYGGSFEIAEADIAHFTREDYRTVVLAADERRASLLTERLQQAGFRVSLDFSGADGLPAAGAVSVQVGRLSAGVEYPEAKLAIITEGQIAAGEKTADAAMDSASAKRRRGRHKRGEMLESYTDLTPGQLVVHEHHGIGRFVGIVPMKIENGGFGKKLSKDYIKIAYRGTDSLYVPVTQLDLVSRYIGTGGESSEDDAPRVKLHKLGGTEWNRARTKARGAAKDLAEGLIKLYAERQRQRGHAFGPDSAWQREFEENFAYTETEDQMEAANEIKADMERDIPMERLLCGDVGYGKTEVALRAVMKCVLDGKQAAILVPTTVLAQQHHSTATHRFSGYPVRIEVLSRFQTTGQAKKTLAALERGEIDIVIGTHKLLQKDVVFKDLGLLVVDEEQRFGVSHKERLKEISKAVDVLTLSATPIPRTLNMALSGIRDMSTIEEPPGNRHPVQTYVMEHNWGIVADAIRREISRGGQVYYLHNRVDSIEGAARQIRELIEGVTIGVAHGQMDEKQLSRVMDKMTSGQLQVLVCTTIIETGLDIPNVNTLIIENADRMGLAQLHQIRGRVGRSNRHAMAYLTYRPGKVLTEVAMKRLAAIREFAAFNAGFKIALRDLEIRGAGNVLGAQQSGHMANVGYDMYLKLLHEAVQEQRGEMPKPTPECTADFSLPATIPAEYVAAPEQRIDLYRRIAHIRTEEDAADMADELRDRFGTPPDSVLALIQIARLRTIAAPLGISEIAQKGREVRFTFAEFDWERVAAVCALGAFRDMVSVKAGAVPIVQLKLESGTDVLAQVRAFLEALAL